MAIKTIGAAGDYTTIALWSAYVKALGTLTENESGQCIDDANYTYGALADLDMSSVTLAGFTITLEATTNKHNGDFGNGSRVEAAASGGGMYTAKNIIINDMSFINTEPTSGGARVFRLSGGTFNRVIAKSNSTGANGSIFEMSIASVFNSCRASGGNRHGWELTSAAHELRNCTATNNASVGFSGTSTGTMQNCVGYGNGASEFAGTYTGAVTNNASDDATHPGTSGVVLTGNPFEADGFTPTAGELAGVGVNLSISLDAANLSYAATPAIGAYEATAASASITSVGGDDVVLDAEQNVGFVTTGFTSEISTVQLVSGTSITNATGVTSTSGTGDFDLPDITGYVVDTVGCPLTTANNIVVARLTDA